MPAFPGPGFSSSPGHWPWSLLCFGLIFRQSLSSWSHDVYRRSRLYIFQALSPIGFHFIYFDWVISGPQPGNRATLIGQTWVICSVPQRGQNHQKPMEWEWITGLPRVVLGRGCRRRVNGDWATALVPGCRGVWRSQLTYTPSPGSPGAVGDQWCAEKDLSQWFIRGQEVHEAQLPSQEVVERRCGLFKFQRACLLSWACLDSVSLITSWDLVQVRCP